MGGWLGLSNSNNNNNDRQNNYDGNNEANLISLGGKGEGKRRERGKKNSYN